jgi:hypothetical protein
MSHSPRLVLLRRVDMVRLLKFLTAIGLGSRSSLGAYDTPRVPIEFAVSREVAAQSDLEALRRRKCAE